MKRRPKRRRSVRVTLSSVAPGEVTSAVFAPSGAASRGHAWIAGALSIAAMGTVAGWVRSMPARPRVERERRPEVLVELIAVPSLAPPPAEPPPRVSATPRPVRSRPHRPRAAIPEPQAPAPAQAAALVAHEAPADEAPELASLTVATGGARQYAGGTTSSNGADTSAVSGTVTHDRAANDTGGTVSDLSQPVRLREGEWDCPWPAEADALGIDEQSVLLRVMVRPDGTVESAEALRDAGSGFTAAALSCASRTCFQAARDREGNPMRARSGPIRVHFTR